MRTVATTLGFYVVFCQNAGSQVAENGTTKSESWEWEIVIQIALMLGGAFAWLYQWRTMRSRPRLKADLEILQAYKEVTANPAAYEKVREAIESAVLTAYSPEQRHRGGWPDVLFGQIFLLLGVFLVLFGVVLLLIGVSLPVVGTFPAGRVLRVTVWQLAAFTLVTGTGLSFTSTRCS